MEPLGRFLGQVFGHAEETDLAYHDCDAGPDEVWLKEGEGSNEGFEWPQASWEAVAGSWRSTQQKKTTSLAAQRRQQHPAFTSRAAATREAVTRARTEAKGVAGCSWVFQWRKLGGEYGKLREGRNVQTMVTRVVDTMVFVKYKREHFDCEQRSAFTQTSSRAAQDAGTQVEGHQRQVGRTASTQTGRCKQKEAATQVGWRTKIGVDSKATQVQVRTNEQGSQAISVGCAMATQAGNTGRTHEVSIQTDRQKRKDTGTQVGGREKNPGEAADEKKQQQSAHVHIAPETARGSQVQAKLVEAMRLHPPKEKMSASMVMQMCQKRAKEREVLQKCGTPGAGEEQQFEEAKQMVVNKLVNKLKHTGNSQLFSNLCEPMREFRNEKKGDVIRAREPKVP